MTAWQPTDTEIALLRHTIETYGDNAQTLKAIEEHAEAAAAITRHSMSGDLGSVAEEIADTEIMQAQLKLMHSTLAERISKHRANKLAALAMRTGFPETL